MRERGGDENDLRRWRQVSVHVVNLLLETYRQQVNIHCKTKTFLCDKIETEQFKVEPSSPLFSISSASSNTSILIDLVRRFRLLIMSEKKRK